MLNGSVLLKEKEELSPRLTQAITYWRNVYLNELHSGPSRARVAEAVLEDFLAQRRPFFSSLDEADNLYSSIYRSIEFSALSKMLTLKTPLMRVSGYNLGASLVRNGVVRSLDEAPYALALYRIGLLDIIEESLNVMKLNIYECISCYGVPNIGRTLCDFEAGVLQGILAELYGPNRVREKYCWGLGYSFCGFEVVFE